MESRSRINFNKYTIRKAVEIDKFIIWNLLQEGILKRKEEGSTQWQDGYPNEIVVATDIQLKQGYVIENERKEIIGYFALIFDKEPAYDVLTNWSFTDKYAVIHRLVTSQKNKVKGLAEWILIQIEKLVLNNKFTYIKVDTNFDNNAMLYLFQKLSYKYIGEVYFRGSARKAFEKKL